MIITNMSWHFQSSSRDDCFFETLDPQAIRLRFLCHDDIDEIQNLCTDWFPISYPNEWYEQIVTPKYYSLVALYEKAIIGLIVCEIKSYQRLNKEDRDILPATFSGCDVGYILSLGVHNKFRRRGIGSLLLDTFLRYLTTSDKQNVKAIFLHVLTTNQAAIIFYEKRNFRYHSFLPYYYSIQGRQKDAFLFVNYINGGRPTNILDQIKQTIYEIICRPILWILQRVMHHNNRVHTQNSQYKFSQI